MGYVRPVVKQETVVDPDTPDRSTKEPTMMELEIRRRQSKGKKRPLDKGQIDISYIIKKIKITNPTAILNELCKNLAYEYADLRMNIAANPHFSCKVTFPVGSILFIYFISYFIFLYFI